MKRFLQLLLLLGCCATACFAQEVCDNGIDDDKDGLIDCFDPDCTKFAACTGGYVGNDVLCEAKPSEFPKFSMELESASPNGSATHLGRVVVGDIDGDGTIEMVAVNNSSKKIVIMNGENVAKVNQIQKEITVSYEPAYEDIMIGNLDGDACSEIFILGKDWKVRAYDCKLNEIWAAPITLPGDPGMMGLADFNGDGKVELYAKNAIFNAHTGETIVAADANWGSAHGGPVAVDILNDVSKNAHELTDAVRDDNLELVCGGSIFSVNITGKTIKEEKKLANFAQKKVHDATSVADFNNDGSLDVICSGKWTGTAPADKTTASGYTTVFFWDVKNNVLKTFSDAFPDIVTINRCGTTDAKAYYASGWGEGTGRINIADIDGDGKPNAVFVSGKFLYALKDDFKLLWRIVVNEETSGNTGCTLFDFNGDGQSEIIYRDEKYVYIIDGVAGKISDQKPCVSRTNREYPIVADVDNDGNTELCVTCRTVDFYTTPGVTDPTDPDYTKEDRNQFCNGAFGNAQVRVFRSAGEPWVPARKVWNQHGYFNVNVNDNLTIPKIQQKHHLVFSNNVCTVGPNRPLNSFLNQSPFLNSKGCPKYASPDLAHVANTLVVKPPVCPERSFDVSFKITNKGDLTLTGTVPITFYDGNPTLAGANKLNTVNVNLSNFKTGNVQTINATVQGPGKTFTLYIVLNDGGTTVPTPIRMPNTNFIECDYDNNIISAPVSPLPVPMTAVTLQDNIRCTPGSTADNGSVGAYVLINGVKNSTDFTFYWSAGTVAKPIASADHTGATWTSRPENTYTVYAVHNALGCFADTTDTKVVKISKTVDPDIFSVHDYDQCTPANGAVRVVVNDGNGDGKGENPDDYSYVWYEGNDIFGSQAGINDSLSGLSPISYTVLVTHKGTSCQAIESFSIPDKTSIPTVAATATDATCSNPTSGSVSASVGNVTTGYTFKWYKGTAVKATPDFTGVTYANRPVGKYTVTATNNKSNCVSAPVTVEVVQTAAPVVVATLVSDQTSCDPSQPTGAASAAVGGTTAGYTFEWFKGQNTLAANRVATTAAATGLTNTIYTVKATSTATGCSAIDEVIIGFDVKTPTITAATVMDPTQCTSPNGSIIMSVSLDAVTDYTFSWYKGTSVKATPDFVDTDGTLAGLPPGDYTVQAVNKLRHCNAQPVVVTLNDDAPVVSYNLSNIVRPSTCNDSNGSLEVSVNATGNTGGFDFEWRAGQAPYQGGALPATATSNTSAVGALMTGAYTVIVTNRDNGCESTHVFDLPFDDAQILSYLAKTDVTNCVPGTNGDITVELTKTTGFLETDYRIDMFQGANDLGAAAPVFRTINTSNGVTQYQAASPLQPGKYTFVAITTNPARSTFNCRSVPVTVEILKDTKNPEFTANTPANNMTCSATVGSGQIAVSVTNPTNNLSDYTFAWFEGANTTDPALGTNTSGAASGTNGSTATNLPAGSYTVVVTKTSGTSAGCESKATYEIFDNRPTLMLTTADLAVTDITRCDMMTNGAVQVNFVKENGTQFPAANYSYSWYNDSPSGPQLIVGSTAALLSGLGAGKVFVQPTNLSTLCTTPALVEATILDKTNNTVSVALVDFTVPTFCLKPVNVQGDLTSEASGSSTTGYTYTWFAGATTADPALPAANVSGTNGEIAQNLTGGTYTVEVLNNSTQCKTTDTYVLPTERRPVLLTASAEPLTVCFASPLDGSIFASVTSGNKNDYTYNWYVNTVKATADFTSTPIAAVTNLGLGRYIVMATDNADATCTVSDTVTVSDKRIMPVAAALPTAPVAICDPARPDGAASVSVGGDISNYTFDWYNGATPSGSSFYTGADIGGLRAVTYSVIATSIVTGCSDTTSVTVLSQPAIVPLADIDVLSLVTSCVEGNGSVTASVGGNTSDYIFNWYNGTAAKMNPDFTGEIYDHLIVGSYSVTATSRITGCVSPLATAPVGDSLLYPEFTYTTTAAMCMRDASEPGNGLAAVFMTNSANIDAIEWQTDGGIVTGPILEGVKAGTYTVTVTTFLGCSTSKDIEIKPEIHPYNGISKNGDSQNDYFLINCIESFPLNSVKIFNRAGTLVYEADGYDNSAVLFDGKSNKGLSVMGTDLPGGTYFYIIDKHDGSKPLAGYLELIH